MTKQKKFIEAIAWIGLVTMLIYGVMYGRVHAMDQSVQVPAEVYVTESTTTFEPLINVSSAVFSSSITIRTYDSLQWYDKETKIIMKIDGDGDIFLRGKWIGYDRRLSTKYRETWYSQ